MAQEPGSLLKKSGDVLRELAVHQGTAYQQYGEALQKFGNGEINVGKLFNTAGDLYVKEAARISAQLFEAGSEVFNLAFSKIGIQVLEQNVTPQETAKQEPGK